jgi:hypothetical protein
VAVLLPLNIRIAYRTSEESRLLYHLHPTSAANASGFLLVSLSKTPRVRIIFLRSVLSEAFPIKASDKPARVLYFAFLDCASGHQGHLFIQILRT